MSRNAVQPGACRACADHRALEARFSWLPAERPSSPEWPTHGLTDRDRRSHYRAGQRARQRRQIPTDLYTEAADVSGRRLAIVAGWLPVSGPATGGLR